MKKTAWLGLVALAAHPVHAGETALQSAPVLVTADRFPETEPTLPASVSVITRDDIAETPALDIPDVLKTRAGIQVSPLYGSEGIDAPIDMRGFGETGASNSLILLDGQRLNPIDMGGIQWAAIPLQAIERIEIIHGGGSVLYGDRATGGVINLISDKSGQPHASLTGTLGSYGYRALDGYAAGGGDGGYYTAFLHSSSTDGWRQNTDSEQHTLSGRGGYTWGEHEVFIDYSVYHQDYGMPGSIDSRTFHDDPKHARTPLDNNEKEGYRLRPGISFELTDTLRLDAEVSLSGERQQADNASFGSTSDRTLRTLAFTPRLRWQHGLGALDSVTTAGLDYYHGRVDSDSSTFASQFARQISRAVYLQNTTRFD
ncbi:MAG TPA: TonB-dependent receptor plug domain-containing protein, partial [Gallionella sp.]|nr:TonB-dependent receptor plug domain-containing protein [Gallionella sp.]